MSIAYAAASLDASADCTHGGLRLIEGPAGSDTQGNFSEGRVEICINNAWGAICGDYLGHFEAAVACAQLGGFNRECK